MLSPHHRSVSISVLTALLLASCADVPRLRSMRSQALWFSDVFVAKATRAAERCASDHEDTSSKILQSIYAQASRDMAALAVLLANPSAESGLHTATGVAQVECQFRTIIQQVGDAEKLAERHQAARIALARVAKELENTIQGADPASKPTNPKSSAKEPDPKPAEPKATDPKTGPQEPDAKAAAATRLKAIKDAAESLRTATPSTLEQEVVAAETLLQGTKAASAEKKPIEQARLKAQLEGDVASLNSRLETERKKKNDSSRVRRLEKALGVVKSASR